MRTAPFGSQHGADAAELLARQHRLVADRFPGYEPLFADRDVAKRLVESMPTDFAVAATEGGSLAGFLGATIVYGGAVAPGGWLPAASLGGGREARIRLVHHGAKPELARSAYRSMYAAVSGKLVENGCFSHEVVSVADPSQLQVWFELGFGVDQVQGLRRTEPLDGTADPRVRIATSEDDPDRLAELAVELFLFHARPPMLSPSFVDRRTAADALGAAVASEKSAIWLAELDGAVVGFMELGPEARAAETVRIGTAIVSEAARGRGLGRSLFEASMGWSREHGFGRCLVGWTSSNPVSDPFWRSLGFVPAYYSLRRRVDERIAWAGANRDRIEL